MFNLVYSETNLQKISFPKVFKNVQPLNFQLNFTKLYHKYQAFLSFVCVSSAFSAELRSKICILLKIICFPCFDDLILTVILEYLSRMLSTMFKLFVLEKV